MKQFETSISIHNIFSSLGHHYFTRTKFDVGDAPTFEHESVALEEGRGITGDRFEFSKYPLTFFSLEVAETVCSAMELACDVKLFRRNIVLSGIDLNALIGKRFIIGTVEFEGMQHCAPCLWMNAVMKKGAYALMKGRGGLRVKVIKGGPLHLGEQLLLTDFKPETNPLNIMSRPKIP